MTNNNRDLVVGTGPKALMVSEEVARLIDLRQNGYNLKEAAALLNIPYGTAQSWIRKYIRHVSSKAVIAFRDQELGKLENMEDRIIEVLNRQHFVVFKGEVVTVPDPNSPQVMNPVTGQMEHTGRLPLVDSDPITRGIQAYLKISERKAKLLGADRAPDKGTDQDPSKKPDEAPQQTLTPAMFQQAMRQLATKIGIDLNPAGEVTDLDPIVLEQK